MIRTKNPFILAGTVVVALGLVIWVIASMGADGEPVPPAQTKETTEDIGPRFPDSKVQLEASSFAPTISREDAIAIVHDLLRTHFHIDDADTLPTEATVSVFTGETHDDRRHATNVEAWVVVVNQVPFSISGGPAGPYEGSNKLRFSPTRYSVVIDAHTGAVIHSVMSRKIISSGKGDDEPISVE